MKNAKPFISYYKKYIGVFISVLFASLVMSLLSVAYPIITRKVFNEYIKTDPVNINAIIFAGITLVVIYILRFGLKLYIDYFGHSVGTDMQSDMRRDLFEKFEHLPMKYYDTHETGELMSRLTNDLQDISELAHHGPENILITSITILASLIYLLTINVVLALVLLGMIPILFLISFFTRKKHLKAYEESKKFIGGINAQIASSLSGIRATKAFNNEELEIEHFDIANDSYNRSRKKVYKYMAIFHSSNNFVIDLFNAAVIIGGALLTAKTNIFSIEDYLAFAVSVSLFTNPINTLVQFTEQLTDGKAGFNRFKEIMNTPIDEEKENAIKQIHLKGNIQFKNVSFSYIKGEPILTNVCFSIKAGECVALVGSSGGGKTTICHLLPNFYHVKDNLIFYDGIDINNISFKGLRDNIGIVQQDVFLFSGTIRSNIAYGNLDATDNEIYEAAKKANIYDFIKSLPNGLDTRVGERGVRLSGGEKQRISIARIFLKDPSILILDEATSALDNTTEIAIQNSLNELMKGRTCIIVAHRLSTIKNANRIFVIESGKILESGNHEELMAKNGRYKVLYDQQFKLY